MRQIWEAIDGKQFTSEIKCEQYEKSLDYGIIAINNKGERIPLFLGENEFYQTVNLIDVPLNEQAISLMNKELNIDEAGIYHYDIDCDIFEPVSKAIDRYKAKLHLIEQNIVIIGDIRRKNQQTI